jgi:hypothetical protein
MRFAYKRRGGPLLNWSGPTPPYQSRAGETRSLGDFYATTRNSVALRRYGGTRDWPGGPKGYEHTRALGELNVPRPGAPEVVSGYESPEPGAATIHLGGYMPEGAARGYGQTMLSADAPAPEKPFDMGLVRKASALAAAYHGVRRNNGSILWGLVWAAAAFVSPLYGTLVPAFAMAQGFGEARPRSNPAMGAATRKKRRRMFAKQKQRRRSRRRTVKRRPRNVTRKRTKRWGTRRGH